MDRPATLFDMDVLAAQGVSPEDEFAACASPERRKRLGQFFTPLPIARAMTGWCCRNRPRRMLDPSIGPGIFAACALELTAANRPREIDGYDIDGDALAAARERLSEADSITVRMHRADFLSQPIRERFDVIVCNPPYIRHHEADVPASVYDELEALYGLRLSRMTNVYSLFMLRIASLLSERGRAAIITPAEFLNADFGVAVKQALLKSGRLRGFVIFDHAASVFEGILTTAAITLLGGAVDVSQPVRWAHVDGMEDLEAALSAVDGCGDTNSPAIRVESIGRTTLDSSVKWGHGAPEQKRAGDSARRTRLLSDFATCSRGIATGANDFFTLTDAEARRWELLADVLRPCVTKAPQVRGLHWTNERMAGLIAAGKKALLLDAAAHADDAAVQRYVAHGEAQGLQERYLTRHRKPWFAIERREVADIWVATFGRGRLRFVWNQSTALHLTAFHGLRLRPEHRRIALHVFAFLHCERGTAECRRNHRVYGDGLLKFEPRDVERLSVPDFESMPTERLAEIETAGRALLGSETGEIPATISMRLNELFE